VISSLVAGIVAGYGIALPVGAIATYLIGLGVRERFQVSAAAALGVATTDGLFAAVAVAGGVGLQKLLRPVTRPLIYLSAAVLVVLALRTIAIAVRRYRAISPTQATEVSALGPLRAYVGLIALTAMNPTTVIYFAALVLGGRAESHGSASAISGGLFAAGAFLASANWQLFLAGSGAMLGRVLTSQRGQLCVPVLSGAIMLALAGQLLAQ
jgi:arginine exporter protein ArgO